MVVFLLFSSIYFFALLYFIIRKIGKVNNQLSEGEFISRKNTDAIKGAAAVGILISHIATLIKISVGAPTRYYVVLCTTLGGIGVNLFFFASGFGNYYSISKIKEPSVIFKWLIKRVMSITIIFLVCSVLASFILWLAGCHQSISTFFDNIIKLKMPLRTTWYLKIQILLYIILFVSCALFKRRIQVIILVGLSFVSSLVLYKLGYAEEWWKSTMCFSVGYSCAMYKNEVLDIINKNRKKVLWISIVSLPLCFVMACLINIFVIKVLGNTLLMVSMMIIVNLVHFDSKLFAIIGSVSLELYLIHISLCSYFLRHRTPDSIGIICVILLSFVAVIIAKYIDKRLLSRIKRVL